MEATGDARWFEKLLGELNYELWIGDPAAIGAKRVRKEKNDRQDAEMPSTCCNCCWRPQSITAEVIDASLPKGVRSKNRGRSQ